MDLQLAKTLKIVEARTLGRGALVKAGWTQKKWRMAWHGILVLVIIWIIYIYYQWLLLASVCYLWDLLLVMIGYWMIWKKWGLLEDGLVYVIYGIYCWWWLVIGWFETRGWWLLASHINDDLRFVLITSETRFFFWRRIFVQPGEKMMIIQGQSWWSVHVVQCFVCHRCYWR